MNVVESIPSSRIDGLDDEGRLLMENGYVCPHCGHRTGFPLFALGNRADRWKKHGSEAPNLDPPDAAAFGPARERWLGSADKTFAIEWTCACDRPVAIVWKVTRGLPGVDRFVPLVVLERG